MLTWLRRTPPTPTAASQAPLQPLRSGAELIAEHHAQVAQVRRLVGVPDAHWDALYRRLLEGFGSFVQALPVSASSVTGAPPCLQLAARLGVLERALRLRRGRLLPAGVAAEDRADIEDAWTYAVATAALLRGLGLALLGVRVDLFDARGRELGPWDPWTGPMSPTAAAQYRVRHGHDAPHRLHAWLPLLTLHSMVPALGLCWLSGDRTLFESWLATVGGGDPRMAGELGQIVAAAEPPEGAAGDGGAAAPDLRMLADRLTAGMRPVERIDPPGLRTPPVAHTDRSDSHTPPAAYAERNDSHAPPSALTERKDAPASAPPFLAWLREGLRTGRLTANTAGARVHGVDEGLLLVTPSIFRDYAGLEGWELAQKSFLKLGLHRKTPQGRHHWSFRALGPDGAGTRIEGIILPAPPGLMPLAESGTRLQLHGIDEPVAARRTAPAPDQPSAP